MKQLFVRIILIILVTTVVTQPDHIAGAQFVSQKNTLRGSQIFAFALQKQLQDERIPCTNYVIIKFRDTNRSVDTLNRQEVQRLVPGLALIGIISGLCTVEHRSFNCQNTCL